MSTKRKFLILACAAILALIVGLLALWEPVPVLSPPTDRTPSVSLSPGRALPDHAPGSKAPGSAPDYFHLADGLVLNYLVEVSYKGGSPRFGLAKTTIEGREIIRGKEYFKVFLRVTGVAEMREPVLRYCRKSGEAYHEILAPHQEDPAFEVVALPLTVGAGVGWDKDTPEERSTWRMEGTEAVSLMGKEYANCLRIAYERRLKRDPEYFETGHCYLAPNVGVVKQVASCSGTHISFTLDERDPQTIAFYTTWAGTYEASRGRGKPREPSIRLSADGKYAIEKTTSNGRGDVGRYARHPTRQGELVFQSEDGRSIPYGFREELGPDATILHLICLAPGETADLDYIRRVREN
jgi:hypothetical protein